MTLRIPLSSTAAAKPAAGSGGTGGLRIALPISINSAINSAGTRTAALSADVGKTQVLRAVALAAAASGLERALEIVKEATDTPAAIVGKIDGAQLAPVLDAVVRVQEDRSQAPEVDTRLNSVAQAVGADPALASAALVALAKTKANPNDKTSAAIDSALYWVASVNLELLNRCTQVLREKLIDLIPDQQTRLQRIEDRLGGLELRVKALEDGRKLVGGKP